MVFVLQHQLCSSDAVHLRAGSGRHSGALRQPILMPWGLLQHLANVEVTGVFLAGQSVQIVAATQSFAGLLPVARGGVAAGTQPEPLTTLT